MPKLGPKAYEQCAGFLRVRESKSVLDNTASPSRSYAAAEKLLALSDIVSTMLQAPNFRSPGARSAPLENPRRTGMRYRHSDAPRYCEGAFKAGARPARRAARADTAHGCCGYKGHYAGHGPYRTVRNVIDFGVFVDIGVHQDGLVHISEISNKFIRHPSEIVTVGDVVNVLVLAVDTGKKRISLSMKQAKQ